MTARPIRFVHRGRPVEVRDAATTRTLLDWLREDARCTGTKEGCAEGDCGACTVVVAERGADGQPLLRPVNACIQFLPALDGKAVLTVEDLGTPEALHPVQQALMDCHGSQCGFCTPGFVMSLAACYERHAKAGTRPTRQQLADDLAGNLCRCTGYRPILDAGEAMFDEPVKRFDLEALAQALAVLAEDTPLHYEALGRRFWAPRTLADFAALRQSHPGARLLAGCTDIGLWVNKQHRELGDILYLGRVAELQQLRTLEGGVLRIGAAVPLEDAYAALTAQRPQLQIHWLRFASPPVRHAGTLVGNLANGSPIGDTAPLLLALDATLLLRRGEATRALPLQDFYLDYMKNALAEGEFIEAVEVPAPAAAERLQVHKLAKRFDSDISAVCAGLRVELDAQGRVVLARLAFGGMAATARRAAQAEAALLGRPWDEAALQAACTALSADFQPLSDLRASAGYRQRTAAALLRRFWLGTRPDAPLAPAQLDLAHGLRLEVTP